MLDNEREYERSGGSWTRPDAYADPSVDHLVAGQLESAMADGQIPALYGLA